MKKIFALVILIGIAIGLTDCVSGKGSYKQGNYYQAVLDAVQRLRSNPDHKKTVEVLRVSYPAAVSLLETQTQNLLASNDNGKWRSAVQNYNAINRLYEEIQRSPGALQIIPKPVSKYNELTEAKQKAAEETYAMALDAMMKNTREDAKRAYFLFREANTLSPQYKESIEMGNQAKFNATLKVVVEPAVINATNWNYEAMVFGYRGNEFVRFYSADEARNENLERVDQYLTWQVNQYNETLPNITKSTRDVTDSVKTGEKKVGDKVIPQYTKVQARVTTFTKTVRGRSSINLIIMDGASKATIQNQQVASDEAWTQEWAIYTGDIRALSQNLKQLTQRKEPFLSNNELRERVRQDLGQKFNQAIAAFYQNY
jgi:hypothetical protein